MGRVVLVTGVCRDVGGRFAQRIAAHPEVEKVVGVDIVPPRRDLGDVAFVRADIRNPVIGKVLAAEGVDTVVHLSVIATARDAGSRTLMKEINVIGSMQLLAACQRSSDVRRLVVKSSAQVYGTSPRDPSKFTEEMTPQRLPRSGFGKDSAEVEGYVRGFARRRPDVTVAMLRCANLMGPTIDTSLTRYLSLPVVPTLLGYDARLQVCHEEDALAALERATLTDVHGTFNVAGDGIMMLSQVIRRLGRPWVAIPRPAFGMLNTVVPQVRAADLSTEITSLLTYGRGLDTSAMRKGLGFSPTYTTAEAFADFAAAHPHSGLLEPERLRRIEEDLTETLSGLVSNARG